MSNALQFSSAISQDSRAICVSKRLLHERVASSADDSGIVIQYDLHWHFLKQQLHLELISGREVGVPALARERMVPEPIPIKARDSKPGPRRDHRSIARCIFGSFTQRNEIFRFESIDSIGVSFEVIDQSYRIQLELPAEFVGINDPGEIRDFAAAGSYWTCDPEASTLHRY